MDVSVVILSYNTRELLKRCLTEAKLHFCGLACEIVVVDNSSGDGSAEMVKWEFPDVKIIANANNIGYAAGNNVGIRASCGEFVLLLNSDAFLNGNALLELVNFLKTHPKVGIVGPRLTHEDGSLHLSCRHFPSLFRHFVRIAGLYRFFPFRWAREWDWMCSFAHDRKQRVDMLSGACWMLRRSMLDEIGLLNDKLFLYGEEFDLCWRAARVGWETWFVPTDSITHLGGKSSPDPVISCVVTSFHRYRSDYLNLCQHYGKFRWFCVFGLDQISLTWRYWKSRLWRLKDTRKSQAFSEALKNSRRAGWEMMRVNNESRKVSHG